jgi:hypothetical protein
MFISVYHILTTIMLRPITSPKPHVMSEEEIRIEYNAKKQQEQIDIFYRTGRRIHNVTMDTIHMRKFRNEVRHDDKPPWNRILRCHDDSDRGGRRWKIDVEIFYNPGGQYPMPTKSTKSTKSDKRDIVEGYQGIMPLNITDILPQFRKQALERHEMKILWCVQKTFVVWKRSHPRNGSLRRWKPKPSLTIRRHLGDDSTQSVSLISDK